ncbi:6-hydroxymethylpterin diphosphokinase MptE-like protein [uncultured Campylobacter sp.]|uniref:motility associated factor glycosyltransferase family protein n=1 Tax=uncultured Campylobacter sp. TaxID=218934 RepID=UPI00262CCC90|nr:6-hydroxymethylpterin diphosphokinase MptE-like protein [uncultured Campylobacter sp.]
MNNIFVKNVNFIQDESLKQRLFKTKVSKYLVFNDTGGGYLDINIFDTKDKTFLYSDTLSFYNIKLDYFKQYKKYPILYFYGFGLGIFYTLLLEQNENLKHIVVFEDDIELLFTALSEVDFSKYLQENKIILLSSKFNLYDLFSQRPFFSFLLVYFLDIHSEFYDKNIDKILALQQEISGTIKQIRISRGNDSGDTLQGISNFLANLKDEIQNPSLKELKIKRKNASKTAIIVSTGPSLHKQLNLLREYEAKATVLCADSAYSILCENGIQCDYVLMTERSEVTAKLLKRNFEKFDQNIIFVMMGVVHPLSIEFLKNTNRKFIIIHHKDDFTSKFKLKDFCGFIVGASVAHNAFLLAKDLGHKNIIFIGQDLAYANDGASHSKGYTYGEFFESEFQKEQTIAYGGNGFVYTNRMWQYFRYILQDFFKQVLQENSDLNIINATEGGARIDFTQELSFKECSCFLDNTLKKPFNNLQALDKNIQDKLFKKIENVKNELLQNSKDFISFLETNISYLQTYINNENYDVHIIKDSLEDIFMHTDKELKKYPCFYGLTIPYFTQLELNTSKLSLQQNSELQIIEEYVKSLTVLLVSMKLLREIISKNI